MNWKTMKQIEPDLARLERHAEHAGRHQADWWSVLLAVNESLSKCVGRGAIDERLQSSQAYEVCRAAIFAAWSKGTKGGQRTFDPVPQGLEPLENQTFLPDWDSDVVESVVN